MVEYLAVKFVMRRPDLVWAADHAVIRPHYWVAGVGCALLLETAGVPFITRYFVPPFVFVCISGGLMFFYIPTVHNWLMMGNGWLAGTSKTSGLSTAEQMAVAAGQLVHQE